MYAQDEFTVDDIDIEENLPEGTYTVQVRMFEFTKLEGSPAVLWVLEIIEGEFTGLQIAKISRLTSTESKEYLRKELTQKLGLELPERDKADVREVAKLVTGMKIVVTRRNESNFWKCYVVSRAIDEEDYKF